MELWFISAIGGAVFAGISNFYFKQAAVKEYNAELFTFYGGVVSVLIVGVIIFLHHQSLEDYGWFGGIVFAGGFITAQTSIFKIKALQFIDSTIYFPLFKLLAPALAIVAGILVFHESFTTKEWFGMILGLLVPLLLITKAEHGRQQNLLAGLVLVLVTGVLSAVSAVLNKFATDASVPVLLVMVFAAFGILAGTTFTLVLRKGIHNILIVMKEHSSMGLLRGASLRSIFISISMGLMLFAYTVGGTLAIVQTIHSMYILIPIVLAIIFYNEHWNVQKVTAIILSVASLGLLR